MPVRRSTKVVELRARSLSQAFDSALNWMAKANDGGLFWFRGMNNSRLELEPGAYWRKDYDEFGPLLDFVQEGGAFATIGGTDEWKTYYLAQHHGIPTRLLDWTESFSAALFFALDNLKEKNKPCVWIVRPDCINQLSTGWEGLYAPEQIDVLQNWLPHRIREGVVKVLSSDGLALYDNSLPLALYPQRNNSRMLAQQGTFTVHGVEHLKLDQWILEKSEHSEKIICKIILDGLDENAIHQLSTLGVRRHTMYPDLTNYIAYLREYWKW